MNPQDIGIIIAMGMLAAGAASLWITQRRLGKLADQALAEAKAEIGTVNEHMLDDRLVMLASVVNAHGIPDEQIGERLELRIIHAAAVGMRHRYAVFDRQTRTYLYPQIEWDEPWARVVDVVDTSWFKDAASIATKIREKCEQSHATQEAETAHG